MQTAVMPMPRSLLRAGIIAALFTVLALLALGVRPAAAQSPEDGCDPNETIACLPLPDTAEPAGPATAGPRIAPPPIPAPCPLPLGGPTPRIAPLLPSTCDPRAVVVAVNRANVLYARALRTWDGSELPAAWSGEALAQVRGYIQDLRGRGVYSTSELRSIVLEELRINGNRATVRTLENWLYRENSRFTGRVTYQQDGWWANRYEMEQQGGVWRVARNEVVAASGPPLPPPLPPPCIAIFPPPPGCGPSVPVLVTVSTDHGFYSLGNTVFATITNTGAVPVYGGGGYRCGLADLEVNYGYEWERAPGGAEICPAIATVLRPGESRMERLSAGPGTGQYRLAVRVSSEGGDDTFYSAPYFVGR